MDVNQILTLSLSCQPQSFFFFFINKIRIKQHVVEKPIEKMYLMYT